MYNFLTKNGQTLAFSLGAILVIAFYGIAVGSGDMEQFTQWDMDGVKNPDRYDLGLFDFGLMITCLLYTSPSPRDQRGSRMPSSA